MVAPSTVTESKTRVGNFFSWSLDCTDRTSTQVLDCDWEITPVLYDSPRSASLTRSGEFALRNNSGGPSRSAYQRLNPGDVPELDALLTSDEAVEGLGRLYLLNRNNGKNGRVVTEYAGTFYETSPMYANERSSTTTNAWGAADGSVRPQITSSRAGDVIGVAHTHWGDQLPTFPTDYAYMRTDLSSNGWWSIVVTRQNAFFVGPSQGQLYYLPTSDFINAGRTSGSSISIGGGGP